MGCFDTAGFDFDITTYAYKTYYKSLSWLLLGVLACCDAKESSNIIPDTMLQKRLHVGSIGGWKKLNTGNDLTADLKGEIEGFKCMPAVLVRFPSLYSQSPRPHILTIPDISLDPSSTLYIPESRDHMPLQGGSWSSLMADLKAVKPVVSSNITGEFLRLVGWFSRARPLALPGAAFVLFSSGSSCPPRSGGVSCLGILKMLEVTVTFRPHWVHVLPGSSEPSWLRSSELLSNFTNHQP